MTELLRKVSAHYVKPSYTEVQVGDTVRVFTRISEGDKTRTQYFDGLVIRRRGGVGPGGTFTVRRIASGVGVERTFPLHSPVIERVEILRTAKVRRARLFTMRGLTGKAARLTEKPLDRESRKVAKHPWQEEFGIKEKEMEAVEEVATAEQLAEEAAEAEAVKDAPEPAEGAAEAGAEAPPAKADKEASQDAEPAQKKGDNAESAPPDAEASAKKQAQASKGKADGKSQDAAK